MDIKKCCSLLWLSPFQIKHLNLKQPSKEDFFTGGGSFGRRPEDCLGMVWKCLFLRPAFPISAKKVKRF